MTCACPLRHQRLKNEAHAKNVARPGVFRYGYNTAGNGRWIQLLLRRKKKAGGASAAAKKKKRAAAAAAIAAAAHAANPDGGGEVRDGANENDAADQKMQEEYGSNDEYESDDEPKPWEIARARREIELEMERAAKQAALQNETKQDGGPSGPTEGESADFAINRAEDDEDDDPEKTIPGQRYNVMACVQRNTLYLCALILPLLTARSATLLIGILGRFGRYGGILEAGNREYTLADFHSLNLDKLDRFSCLREDKMSVCRILLFRPSSDFWLTFALQPRSDAAEWHGSDSENDDDSDSDDDEASQSGDSANEMDEEDDGQAPVEVEPMQVEIDELVLTEAELAAKKAEKARLEVRIFSAPRSIRPMLILSSHMQQEELRKKATTFMGISADSARTAEEILSTPQAGESLAQFFARSKEYWTGKAHEQGGSANRGKELRRDGFAMAEQRYGASKIFRDRVASFPLHTHLTCRTPFVQTSTSRSLRRLCACRSKLASTPLPLEQVLAPVSEPSLEIVDRSERPRLVLHGLYMQDSDFELGEMCD